MTHQSSQRQPSARRNGTPVPMLQMKHHAQEGDIVVTLRVDQRGKPLEGAVPSKAMARRNGTVHESKCLGVFPGHIFFMAVGGEVQYHLVKDVRSTANMRVVTAS